MQSPVLKSRIQTFLSLLTCAGVFSAHSFAGDSNSIPLRDKLKATPFKIAYETYINNNWEIYIMNPDGSNPENLTNTPDERELYPQMSPDGTKICFVSANGEGRDAIRSVY